MICRPGSQEKSIKGWLLEILVSVGHRHLVLLITYILTGNKLIYFCSKGYYQNYWVSTNAAVQLQREEVGHKNSCNVEQYHSNRSHIFLPLFFSFCLQLFQCFWYYSHDLNHYIIFYTWRQRYYWKDWKLWCPFHSHTCFNGNDSLSSYREYWGPSIPSTWCIW